MVGIRPRAEPAAALDRGRGAFTVSRMVVGAAAASERQSVIPP
jgi:hypothetical protein